MPFYQPIHQKKIHAECSRQKKSILQAHTQRKKSVKKIHAYTKSPTAPPPLPSPPQKKTTTKGEMVGPLINF